MAYVFLIMLMLYALLKGIKHSMEIERVVVYDDASGNPLLWVPRRDLNAAEISTRLEIVSPGSQFTWDLSHMNKIRFGQPGPLAVRKVK